MNIKLPENVFFLFTKMFVSEKVQLQSSWRTGRMEQTSIIHLIRACSHEPGTVNYPGVMIVPGKHYLAFKKVNFITLGASSTLSDHYKIIWIFLVFTQIVTDNEF